MKWSPFISFACGWVNGVGAGIRFTYSSISSAWSVGVHVNFINCHFSIIVGTAKVSEDSTP